MDITTVEPLTDGVFLVEYYVERWVILFQLLWAMGRNLVSSIAKKLLPVLETLADEVKKLAETGS